VDRRAAQGFDVITLKCLNCGTDYQVDHTLAAKKPRVAPGADGMTPTPFDSDACRQSFGRRIEAARGSARTMLEARLVAAWDSIDRDLKVANSGR
jgi:hypothetical protein